VLRRGILILAVVGLGVAVTVSARSDGRKTDHQVCIELERLYRYWDSQSTASQLETGDSSEAESIIDDIIAATAGSERRSAARYWHLDPNPSQDEEAAATYGEAQDRFLAYVKDVCGPAMIERLSP
jgi:hypothetical protein